MAIKPDIQHKLSRCIVALEGSEEAALLLEIENYLDAEQARAEKAEAQLAELAAQKSVGEVVDARGRREVEWSRCLSEGVELFTRAAPPVPFVVDSKSFERGLSVLNETLDDCGDSERGLLLALTKMGVEIADE